MGEVAYPPRSQKPVAWDDMSDDEEEEVPPPKAKAKGKAKGKAKAGFDPAPRKTQEKQAPPVEEEEEELVEEKKEKVVSSSLLTKRQQQAASAPSKGREIVEMDAAAATWPEVQDIAASGDGGIDKGRQKHALVVNQKNSVAPYDEFDRYIWKCGFLTRLELKLPAGVLAADSFQNGFPGQMTDLLELILKENALPALPPQLGLCSRLRSMDVSHNKITELPGVETWQKFAGCLENLDLAFNCLTSVESLAPLCKLSTLKLDGNKLSSLEGVSWSELKQLTSLTAVGNEIAVLPPEVGLAGESLQHLDLSENKLVALPEEVCELKKLKDLAAGGNPIKDQKVVKYLEKGGRGLKELFVYLQKPQKGKKK